MQVESIRPACTTCGTTKRYMIRAGEADDYLCADCAGIPTELASGADPHDVDASVTDRIQRLGLSLRKTVDPGFWSAACDAFEAGDGPGFLSSARGDRWWLVLAYDNCRALKAGGMYEAVLSLAFLRTRTNRSAWQPGMIEFLFDQADRARLQVTGDALPGPGPFTVYRGVSGRGGARRLDGYSWTGDFDCACWFANRFGFSDPAVLRATVSAAEVLSYCTETSNRGETEFLVRPKWRENLLLTAGEIRRGATRWTKKIVEYEPE